MRSRYSAFVLQDENYLLKTWHISTRPAQFEFESGNGMRWVGLNIVSTVAGKANDETGTVEFIARYTLNRHIEVLHETSRFLQAAGQWYYLDGDIHSNENNINKIGRNAPCPCGSGKKHKRCCGH